MTSANFTLLLINEMQSACVSGSFRGLKAFCAASFKSLKVPASYDTLHCIQCPNIRGMTRTDRYALGEQIELSDDRKLYSECKGHGY